MITPVRMADTQVPVEEERLRGVAEDPLTLAVLPRRVLPSADVLTLWIEEVAGDRRVLGCRPAPLAVVGGASRTEESDQVMNRISTSDPTDSAE
jgi:hypothetical protein